MGGWTFMLEHLDDLVSNSVQLNYVGRTASASPATGSYSIHQSEQAELVTEALTIE